MQRVSVIIPCFRCGGTIERAVGSVLAQSEPPLEVIVVDDASSDGTPQVLRGLGELHGERVRVITLPRNAGASAARNAGWDAARGELVAFLDADDTWHPRKLEIQRSFMQHRPEYPMTAHRMAYEDDDPQTVEAAGHVQFTEIAFRSLLYRNWFHTSSVMLRRDLPQRFAPEKRYGEDRQLWLDIAGAGKRIARIDLPLVTVYKSLFGASGLSADLWAMEAAELATFRGLRRAGLIGTPLLCALFAWSLARFLRRLVLVAVGRRILPAQ